MVSHRIKGSCADLSLTPLFEALCDLTDDLRYDVRPTLNVNLEKASTIREELISALSNVK